MFNDFHHGENLVGARRAPVMLNDHSRLVYMPHSYGPGVRRMPYMGKRGVPGEYGASMGGALPVLAKARRSSAGLRADPPYWRPL